MSTELFNACEYLPDRRVQAGDGDRVALTGTAGELTYAQLLDRVQRAAAVLREQRVLMFMAGSPGFVARCDAVLRRPYVLRQYAARRPSPVRDKGGEAGRVGGRGTTGVAVPGYDLRILDDTGLEAPPGTPGTLYVRSASTATGYWSRYDASRQVFCGEWLRTGDSYPTTSTGKIRRVELRELAVTVLTEGAA